MYSTQFLGRFLIFFGLIIAIIGLIFRIGPEILPLGRLPGDILLRRGNFLFFFHIATSIVLILLLTLVLNLIFRR